MQQEQPQQTHGLLWVQSLYQAQQKETSQCELEEFAWQLQSIKDKVLFPYDVHHDSEFQDQELEKEEAMNTWDRSNTLEKSEQPQAKELHKMLEHSGLMWTFQ
jgi:hypothetical protein